MKSRALWTVGVLVVMAFVVQWAVADIYLNQSVGCQTRVEHYTSTDASPANAKSVIDTRTLTGGDSTTYTGRCEILINGILYDEHHVTGYMEDTETFANVPWSTADQNPPGNLIRWDAGGICSGGGVEFIFESPY